MTDHPPKHPDVRISWADPSERALRLRAAGVYVPTAAEAAHERAAERHRQRERRTGRRGPLAFLGDAVDAILDIIT